MLGDVWAVADTVDCVVPFAHVVTQITSNNKPAALAATWIGLLGDDIRHRLTRLSRGRAARL